MHNNIHGGDLYKTAKYSGIRKEDILDFSANINPMGISTQLRKVLLANIDELINYPDPECNELRDELSIYTGIMREAIVTGNGASEMIFLLFDVLRPKKILMPAPCFSEYAKAAEVYRTEIYYYQLKEEDSFRIDMQDFITYIDCTARSTDNDEYTTCIARSSDDDNKYRACTAISADDNDKYTACTTRSSDDDDNDKYTACTARSADDVQGTGNIDTILLCNPNNPTSVLINKDELLYLLEYSYNRNIRVMIDEAFIELTLGGNSNSVACYLKQFKNLFVIRALTKIMAMPGLRLGYALGDPEIINKMWDRKIPWSVNTFACNLGKVLTENPEYFKATAEWLATEKEWLYEELLKITGLTIFKPDTNFILIKLQNHSISSSLLKDKLITKGILVRDASNFKFLNNKFIRVAIKDRLSNSRLVEALRDTLRYL